MPPVETTPVHPTHRYLLWLGLLFVLIIGIVVWKIVFPGAGSYASTHATTDLLIPSGAPIPTDADYVSAQKGFQYLVSYTGTGFSPSTLTIQKDEIVRFTNNGQTPLNLSVAAAAPQTLAPGAYVEYPFVATGRFSFTNGSVEGLISVQ